LFPEVFKRVKEWFNLKQLGSKYRFAIASDGYAYIEEEPKFNFSIAFNYVDHGIFRNSSTYNATIRIRCIRFGQADGLM
jgi:hypothetical protein